MGIPFSFFYIGQFEISSRSIIKDFRSNMAINNKKYVAIGLAVGIGAGVAIGAGTDNLALGLAVGAAVGLALGTRMMRRQK